MDKQINMLIVTNKVFSCPEKFQDRINKISSKFKLNVVNNNEVSLNQVTQAEIIFGWPTQEQLQEAQNLKWLHLPSAGADRYLDKNSYCNPEIVLSNSSGVFGIPIAEHVLAMIFAFNRNLREHVLGNVNGEWIKLSVVRDFYGSTVAVIGLGDIGSEIAKRAHAFGCKVLAIKRTPSVKPNYVDELYGEEEVDHVLTKADYVILALPGTNKTKGIISKERLRKMKESALLFNVGRGALVDQEALIEALQEKWIAGAGLDVTTPEPLPADNPLWNMSNVLITSHSSGSSPTNENRRYDIFIKNLEAYIRGEELPNRVSFIEQY